MDRKIKVCIALGLLYSLFLRWSLFYACVTKTTLVALLDDSLVSSTDLLLTYGPNSESHGDVVHRYEIPRKLREMDVTDYYDCRGRKIRNAQVFGSPKLILRPDRRQVAFGVRNE